MVRLLHLQLLKPRSGKLGLGETIAFMRGKMFFAACCLDLTVPSRCPKLIAKYLSCPGSAYVHGLKFASGEYIILMDADMSHHVSKQTSNSKRVVCFCFCPCQAPVALILCCLYSAQHLKFLAARFAGH